MFTSILRLIFRLTIIGTLCLSGLVVCINFPFVTEMISRNTSITTIYSCDLDSMVKIALAGRDFALGTIGKEGLASVISTCGLNPSLLDEEMLTHLQDCTAIFSGVNLAFIILLVGSLVSILITGLVDDLDSVGKLIMQSGLLALVVMIVIAFSAVINFDMFFNNMHTLLFNGGVWKFDANSLLICMYPENFWISMGSVCAIVSIVLSIAATIFGFFVKKI